MKSMTIRNIMSGFRVTGVYPVNRNALKVTEEPAESLAAAAGLAFIPLYSPAKPKLSGKMQGADSLTFSLDEHKRFERRYENGYHLLGDERYNHWLEMYHPQESNSLLDSTFTPDSPGYEWNPRFYRAVQRVNSLILSQDPQESSSFLDSPGSPEYERNLSLLSTINCKLLD